MGFQIENIPTDPELLAQDRDRYLFEILNKTKNSIEKEELTKSYREVLKLNMFVTDGFGDPSDLNLKYSKIVDETTNVTTYLIELLQREIESNPQALFYQMWISLKLHGRTIDRSLLLDPSVDLIALLQDKINSAEEVIRLTTDILSEEAKLEIDLHLSFFQIRPSSCQFKIKRCIEKYFFVYFPSL